MTRAQRRSPRTSSVHVGLRRDVERLAGMTIDRDRRRLGRDESVHRSEPRDQVIDRSAHAGLDLVGARPILGHGRRLREDPDVPAPVGLRDGRHLARRHQLERFGPSLEFAQPSGTVYVRPPTVWFPGRARVEPGHDVLGLVRPGVELRETVSSAVGIPPATRPRVRRLSGPQAVVEPGVMVSVRPARRQRPGSRRHRLPRMALPLAVSSEDRSWPFADEPTPTSSGDGWSPRSTGVHHEAAGVKSMALPLSSWTMSRWPPNQRDWSSVGSGLPDTDRRRRCRRRGATGRRWRLEL